MLARGALQKSILCKSSSLSQIHGKVQSSEILLRQQGATLSTTQMVANRITTISSITLIIIQAIVARTEHQHTSSTAAIDSITIHNKKDQNTVDVEALPRRPVHPTIMVAVLPVWQAIRSTTMAVAIKATTTQIVLLSTRTLIREASLL